MKNIYKYALIAWAVFSFAACNDMIESSEPAVDIERAIIITATREGTDPNTRSVRMDDGTTWWGPKEEISVFYGSGSNGGSKFTSNNTTLAETTEFEGSISMSGNKEFWAVYPYSTENSCDGSSVVTVIPSMQTGSEGNFADDAFPAVGKSSSLTMPFWNICGGIKFFVSRSDIKSVTFKGNNEEVLAGKVKVSFDNDGKPAIAEILEGETEVTLTAPNHGTFKAGKYYYFSLLPCDLSSGFTLTFNTVNSNGTFSSNGTQTVKRSIFGVLKNVDSKVTEWESINYEPEWVDLGLSVKWATFNIGASKPEDCGDYFSWGELEPKDYYDWPTYKWCGGNYDSLTKYNSDSSYGLVDNKIVLEPQDDAATVLWGENWRMPTNNEWEELINNCTWQWYMKDGIKGYIITGNMQNYQDKSIFLPATRYRQCGYFGADDREANYWSSSLRADFPRTAKVLYFNSATIYNKAAYERSNGHTIRPVFDDRIHPESVSLNKSSLSLYVGNSVQLTATISPDDATDKTLSWSSDNTDVATVDADGNVTAIAVGTAIITATANDGGLTASCEVTVGMPVPEAVDLGLSVKWATFNLGATKPEDYGDYFAWGETQPKTDYSWSTYKFELGTDYNGPFSKYVTNSSYGTVDNKTVLEPEDDAAHVNWGGRWRMPTNKEKDELTNKCTWTWTSQNGVNGYEVIGPNGNSIFLPAAGRRSGMNRSYVGALGYFWSSSLDTDTTNGACGVAFNSGDVYWSGSYRSIGLSVRPVYGEFVPVTSITLNESSLSLKMGSSAQLVATISPSNATEPSVRWVSADKSIVTVDENGNVTAVAEGTTTVSAYASNGLSSSCEVTVTQAAAEPEAVDLGLSVKWATFNVGATRPEEYGDYYAWGETETKEDYSWSTYKWSNGAWNKLTKYCTDSSSWDGNDPMDNKTVLDSEDDAAHVILGGAWRLPTEAEWIELRENCTWSWTTNYNGTGIAGRIVTSNKPDYTNKSIFLPAAGLRRDTNFEDVGTWGYYWSSFLYTDLPHRAVRVSFDSESVIVGTYFRYLGRPVRPVCPK